MAKMNAHIRVPLISAVQPERIGAIIDPIPIKKVQRPMMPPAAFLEKKSEAQAAYKAQQAP